MKRPICLLFAGAVAAADLISKSVTFSWLAGRGYVPGEIHWVFPEWFGLTRVMNPGVTGGMGTGIPSILLTGFTFLAAVGIALYLLLPKVQSRWTTTGLTLILGGAIGNLYDRIAYGEVRDFLDVWPRLDWPSWLHHWPTFNVADAAIVTGVSVLVFHSLFLAKDDRKEEKGKSEAEAAGTDRA